MDWARACSALYFYLVTCVTCDILRDKREINKLHDERDINKWYTFSYIQESPHTNAWAHGHRD